MTECIFGTEHPNALIYTLFGKKNKNIPFIQKYDVEVTLPKKINVAVYEKAICEMCIRDSSTRDCWVLAVRQESIFRQRKTVL